MNSSIASASTQSTTLVLGELGSPSSSFTQTGTHVAFIDTTDTQIPYLYPYNLGIDGNIHPGIANVPVSVPGSNGTQWIINLVSTNMKWSDGVLINSTDLAYSFGLFLPTGPYANLSTYDPWGAIRTSVSTVSILNSTAIKITTMNPDPLFPVLTFLYAIYPWHYFKQFTGNDVLQKTSILSGPGDTAYIPVNYTAGSSTFTLKANPYSPAWNGSTPTIQTVVVNLFTTESALVNALAAGTLSAGQITSSDVSALSSAHSLKIDNFSGPYQMMFWIGTQGYPWNTTAFRQAMMYLIPSSKIDSQLFGGSLALGNPLWMYPQAVPTYWPGSSTPTYNYSTSAAETLLSQAGLTKNNAGNWATSNGTAVSVKIISDNTDPNDVRAAQLIQSSLQSVGIQASTQALDTSQLAVDYHGASFQIMLWGQQEVAANPYRWMRNAGNYPQWINSTFKSLLTTSLSDTNPTTSLQELKQAELMFAQAAVGGTIVMEPTIVAYNDQQFTNWQPALSQASSYDFFEPPIHAENVLTSVQPAGLTTSTSSAQTSTGQTTSTGSLTSVISTAASQVTTAASSTTTSANYSLIAAIAVVIIIIAGIGVYLARRRP
ncbi:MAG: ABC transporter substrate-binding protein [Nitrososphaerales archaeon]